VPHRGLCPPQRHASRLKAPHRRRRLHPLGRRRRSRNRRQPTHDAWIPGRPTAMRRPQLRHHPRLARDRIEPSGGRTARCPC
jgi:hypothetical protein